MIQTVNNHTEWHQFRQGLRTQLLSSLGTPLKPGIRADAWTPEEVLHHVLLVDANTANLLEKLVAKVKKPVPRHPDEPWPVRPELMDFPLDTAFSVPAFPGTEPKRGVASATLQALDESTQARHRALAEQATRFRFDEVVYPHPLAGKMNFYEWLVFGGIHERLHLTQLERDLIR